MSTGRSKTRAQRIEELQSQIDTLKAELSGVVKETATTRKKSASLVIKAGQLDLLKEDKTPELSEGCITYLHKWAANKLYNRYVAAMAKTMDKGNIVESDAIRYASQYVEQIGGWTMKNEKEFEDDEIRGTPDVLPEGEYRNWIIDMKSSWDHSTFPIFDNELKEDDYWWQGQGYMALVGREKYMVLYALMNMPDEMLHREARYRIGYDYTPEQFFEFAQNYRYDDLPAWMRLRKFEFGRDEDAIARIRNKVKDCRWYIENHIEPAIEKNLLTFGNKLEIPPCEWC